VAGRGDSSAAGDAKGEATAQDVVVAPIEPSSAPPDPSARRDPSALPVDLVLGASALSVALATTAARRMGSVARPVVRRAARAAPGVPPRFQPERLLSSVTSRGASRRAALGADLSRVLDAVVPWAADQALRRLRLTDVVLEHVDLDAVVAAVDVEAVLDRVDLTAVVLQRVDLDALVTAVLDRVDLTAVVLQRVDLDALVTAVLDRVDLTAVVLQRVDLDALVNAVIAHVDLIGLAEEVIDGVDLPEIIRESTGSMASDAVRGARLQGIAADEAVGRAVDRLLLRRKSRHPAHVLGGPSGHEPVEGATPRPPDGTR
jgi:uncharacterized protein YjbI with pentapeptide repeats